MSTSGRSAGTDAGTAEGRARARVDALFRRLDRLTPDELARIGLHRPPDEMREALLDAIDAAAAATGRETLVVEARDEAREVVLGRYAEGSLHPTWVALNWGLSQGTVEDRVAIVEALADAAAAAVVADVLDPDVLAGLALDAEHVLALAAGNASEGSLARGLAQSTDSDLRRSRALQRFSLVVIVVFAGISALATGSIVAVALVVAVAALLSAAWARAGRTRRSNIDP